MGLVTAITDPLGAAETFGYDRSGRIMGVEKPQDPEQRIRYTLDITRPYHNLLVSEDNVRQKNQSFYRNGNAAVMEDAGRFVR